MRAMLRAVTQKGGTAERLRAARLHLRRQDRHRAEGRSGRRGTTRRRSGCRRSSGFAPADDPRLVIFVMIDEPQGTHYGSMAAGPVFQEVMLDALRWLGVPPDAPIAEAKTPAERSRPDSRHDAPPTPPLRHRRR